MTEFERGWLQARDEIAAEIEAQAVAARKKAESHMLMKRREAGRGVAQLLTVTAGFIKIMQPIKETTP